MHSKKQVSSSSGNLDLTSLCDTGQISIVDVLFHSTAIDFFKKAIALDNDESTALFIEPLAHTYYLSRDFDKAQQEYERITRLTYGRYRYGGIYAKSYYTLGKIYEQQGDKAKAVNHYEKFLSLWKNADPGISEVEDAQKRLTGLQSQ